MSPCSRARSIHSEISRRRVVERSSSSWCRRSYACCERCDSWAISTEGTARYREPKRRDIVVRDEVPLSAGSHHRLASAAPAFACNRPHTWAVFSWIGALVAHRVGIVGGDGIGPEVTAESLKVVRAAGVPIDAVDYDLGGRRYLSTGEVLPDSVLEELRDLDAILLGAVGTPDVPPGVLERGLLLKMRFSLDLYVNLRPFKNGPNRFNDGVDFYVVRENTEGSYAGEGGFLRQGTPNEVATQGSVNTRLGVERCIRYSFELARSRERKHLTLVHKTNVLTFAGDLWQRTFDEVAATFPDVDTAYNHVDAACIYFVRDPGRYDVVVTDNLFGDILTDLGGAIGGGIGRAASANLNPARTGPSLFEPVHGSAPDIAGTGRADPRAAVISAAMMCDFLGEADASARMLNAVDKTDDIDEGTTSQIGDAIAAAVEGVRDRPADAA